MHEIHQNKDSRNKIYSFDNFDHIFRNLKKGRQILIYTKYIINNNITKSLTKSFHRKKKHSLLKKGEFRFKNKRIEF